MNDGFDAITGQQYGPERALLVPTGASRRRTRFGWVIAALVVAGAGAAAVSMVSSQGGLTVDSLFVVVPAGSIAAFMVFLVVPPRRPTAGPPATVDLAVPAPVRVAPEVFHAIARDAWDALPAEVRDLYAGVDVTTAVAPSADDVADGHDPHALAVFRPQPRHPIAELYPSLSGMRWDNNLAPRVELFQDNHELRCANGDALRRLVARTLADQSTRIERGVLAEAAGSAGA